MNTIAAISTPSGSGGVGIIRISGDESLSIINKIFKPVRKSDFKPFTIKLGNIIDSSGNIIDQVLVSYFKAPKSYTGEDICEISCHGGHIVLQTILKIVLENGAKLAQAGEFTKRAFLNGKLDLTQAEAVIDLINSKTEKENKASIKQLEGRLGKEIREIKDEVVDLLADIEANIDYPEYEDIEEVAHLKILNTLENVKSKLIKLESTYESGKILKEGILTGIVGKPNVGKSSLLNYLLKEERAIVTEIPGTTRDTIEETIVLNGITLKLVDTAGIHKTDDIVENIGVEKSKKIINDAELILFILDGSKDITDEDIELYNLIKDKLHILLINKTDLQINSSLENQVIKWNDNNIIRISTKTGDGMNELNNLINELFHLEKLDNDNSIYITNVRHFDLIRLARSGIEQAIASVKKSIPTDLITIDIQNAISNLSEILGESLSQDVLDKIFKKFCVGK